MPLYIAKSGDLDRCYRCLTDSLTHSLTTLKDRATQLLIKYKSGALVTQSGIYNSNRLPAKKKEEKEKENTRDRSVPDGSDNETLFHISYQLYLFGSYLVGEYFLIVLAF